MEYTIEAGDSYWRLSKKFYGTTTLFTFLQEANDGVDLITGEKITIPAPPPGTTVAAGATTTTATTPPTGDVLASRVASGGPETISSDDRYFYYTAQKGDTFGAIAKRFYGDARKYGRIIEANRKYHYESLKAGDQVRVPKD